MAQVTPRAPGVSYFPRNRDETRVRSDAQLLHEFLAGSSERAEAAFAALVERYGPIVHGVCNDVLGCAHDAQDAAQAVFLVLARKARSIRKPAALGPWLHGVAVRVARRARVDAARRKAVERKKAEMTQERHNSSSGPDIMDHKALHEEIDRLPEKYRQPIILFYLQGQTQTEAAETLGWPLGTVQIRLHRGRERLRSRLTRERAGVVALLGSRLPASLGANAGRMPHGWTERTARAAVRFAARKGTDGLIASPVAGLAESVLTGMLADSVPVVAMSVILAVLVSVGLLWTIPFPKEAPRVRRDVEAKAAPVPHTEQAPIVGLWSRTIRARILSPSSS
jgi:RNA polymerase sigma factor (sigma-70 family)